MNSQVCEDDGLSISGHLFEKFSHEEILGVVLGERNFICEARKPLLL